MRLIEAFALHGHLDDRGFCELVDLACDLAEAKTEIELAQIEVEEAIKRRARAETRKSRTEAALRLAMLRAGVKK